MTLGWLQSTPGRSIVYRARRVSSTGSTLLTVLHPKPEKAATGKACGKKTQLDERLLLKKAPQSCGDPPHLQISRFIFDLVLHIRLFRLQLGISIDKLLMTKALRPDFLLTFQGCDLLPMTTQENSTPLKHIPSSKGDLLLIFAFLRRLGERVSRVHIVPGPLVVSISADTSFPL